MKEIITQPKRLCRLMMVLSLVPLALALVSQFFFHMHPCELCIIQRVPYCVIIFFSLLAFVWPAKRVFLSSLIVIIHAFLINAGIAFYHVGVEKHWWVNQGCSSTLDMSSMEALKASLIAANGAHCDQVQFELLGISMAGWNFVYCIILTIFTVYCLVQYIISQKNEALK